MRLVELFVLALVERAEAWIDRIGPGHVCFRPPGAVSERRRAPFPSFWKGPIFTSLGACPLTLHSLCSLTLRTSAGEKKNVTQAVESVTSSQLDTCLRPSSVQLPP